MNDFEQKLWTAAYLLAAGELLRQDVSRSNDPGQLVPDCADRAVADFRAAQLRDSEAAKVAHAHRVREEWGDPVVDGCYQECDCGMRRLSYGGLAWSDWYDPRSV